MRKLLLGFLFGLGVSAIANGIVESIDEEKERRRELEHKKEAAQKEIDERINAQLESISHIINESLAKEATKLGFKKAEEEQKNG